MNPPAHDPLNVESRQSGDCGFSVQNFDKSLAVAGAEFVVVVVPVVAPVESVVVVVLLVVVVPPEVVVVVVVVLPPVGLPVPLVLALVVVLLLCVLEHTRHDA